MVAKRSADIQFDMTEEDVEETTAEAVYGEEEPDATEDDTGLTKPMEYHPLKLPQAQLDKMRAEYDVVIVQDFNDDYELSAEELRERYQFYSVFERMRTLKVKYGNLENYVYAFREAMKCLKAVAAENQVYPEDKFIKLVLSGEIKVSGLKFPKFNGSKKSINWDRVSQYVIDESLDPADLLKKENEARFEVATEDDIRRVSETYFDGNLQQELEEEYQKVNGTQSFLDLESDEEVAGENIVIPMTPKESKQFIKIDRSALDGIKQFAKDQKATGRQLRDFAWQFTQSDFEDFARIEKMDESRGEDYRGMPVFTGDVSDGDAVDRYLLAATEYERRHTLVDYHNKMIPLAEAQELELKDALDEAGWNIRAMYNYAKDEKKEKKKLAKMEKKRKKIKKRLMKLEQLTSGSHGVNSKKKKHKKDSKLQDEMNKGVDRALSAGYDSFQAMQQAMEGFDDDDE